MQQPEFPPGQLYEWADVAKYAQELGELGLDEEAISFYLLYFENNQADEAMDYLAGLAYTFNSEKLDEKFPVPKTKTVSQYTLEENSQASQTSVLSDLDEMMQHFTRIGNEKQRRFSRRIGKLVGSAMIGYVGLKMLERGAVGVNFISSNPGTYISELAAFTVGSLVYLGSERYLS